QLGADRYRCRGEGRRSQDRRRGALHGRDGAAVMRRKNMSTNKDKTNKTKAKTQATNSERQESARLSDILPLPDPKFHGRIGSTYVDSEADLISLPKAPEGAPNVLLVLLDDVGFGQSSTFGGPV